MRTLIRLATLALLATVASSASAREIDETWANTSLSSLPTRSTSASQRREHGVKRDANVPAKYDVAYPVHDRTPVAHERGAI
jgi:hypothetical protein